MAKLIIEYGGYRPEISGPRQPPTRKEDKAMKYTFVGDRLINDKGEVAVVISPGFGAG